MGRAARGNRARWSVLWIAMLVAVCAVVLAAGAGAGEPGDAPNEVYDAAAPTVDRVEPEQAAEIAELRRPPRASDELPDRWTEELQESAEEGQSWGANADLARQTAPGVWILPGAGHVCMASSSPSDGSVGFGCASNADVERGRLAPSDVDANGNGVLTGIVPDGVASVEIVNLDGSTRSADVENNTYRVAIDGDLKEVRFTDAEGGRHTLPMEWKR